jgi:hypothetical protein
VKNLRYCATSVIKENLGSGGFSTEWVIILSSPTTIILQILPRSTAMKYYRITLAFAVLVLASIACQALTGGSEGTVPGGLEPTPATAQNTGQSTTNSGFPMTADAYNVTEAGGSLIFYTKLSMEDTMQFYRNEYTAKGYAEREMLTVVSDGTFSMVFDGDQSGKAVVIQSVNLGDGSRTVSIRLEDV